MKIDPAGDHDAIVNVQGDLPTIEPDAIRAAIAPLQDPRSISRLGAEITIDEERTNPNVVKAVAAIAPCERIAGRFTLRGRRRRRQGPLYHHIGLYAYRRAALEGCRTAAGFRAAGEAGAVACAGGMRIDLALVDTVPLGVDTPADLPRARAMLTAKSGRSV